MTEEYQRLQKLILEEWSHYGHDVAHRLLTKALSDASTLTKEEHSQLRRLLDEQHSIFSANPHALASDLEQSSKPSIRRQPFNLDRVALIAGEAMHATTDGSEQRYQTLAARARNLLKLELEQHGTGWWESFKARRALEKCLREHRSEMVRPLRSK